MTIRTIPTLPRIESGPESEALYAIEHKRSEVMKRNATALAAILGHSKDDYWDKTMPELLASTLDSYETPAAIAAAIGYLKTKGIQVEVP